MHDYEWIIKGYNLARELQNYAWSDKKAGVPIDAWNHLIDAGRYVYMMKQTARRGVRRVN